MSEVMAVELEEAQQFPESAVIAIETEDEPAMNEPRKRPAAPPSKAKGAAKNKEKPPKEPKAKVSKPKAGNAKVLKPMSPPKTPSKASSPSVADEAEPGGRDIQKSRKWDEALAP